MDPDEYHKRITSYIKNPNEDAEVKQKVEDFKAIATYVSGVYDKDEPFQELNAHLEAIEAKYQTEERNRLFYLALPPSVFIPVTEQLKKHCHTSGGINRIIIEKPFGKDTDSCRELVGAVKKNWTEDETFRIDHYLGKEMVKNILVLRFANTTMGAAWDKNWISNVQITFKEPFGTEGRGGYFDEFGIIRDILQNRECSAAFNCAITRMYVRYSTMLSRLDLLQVLSVLTMERPVSFSAEDIRDEKVTIRHPTVGGELLKAY